MALEFQWEDPTPGMEFEKSNLEITHERAERLIREKVVEPVERKVEKGKKVVKKVKLSVAEIRKRIDDGRKLVDQLRGRAEDIIRSAPDVFGDFSDLSKPPRILTIAIREFTKRKEVKTELYHYGTVVADEVWDVVMGRIRNIVRPPPLSPPGPREHGWIPDVVMPILNPFLDGLKERLKMRSKPVVRVVVIGAVTTHATTFFLGRWLAKRALFGR